MTFARCVVRTNQVWNHIEILYVDAELVTTSSALSVLTNSTAWVSTFGIRTRQSTNADVDELCFVEKDRIKDRTELWNLSNGLK